MHTHTAKFTDMLHSGTVYQTCECGAVKVTPFKEPSHGWHACLCCTGQNSLGSATKERA